MANPYRIKSGDKTDRDNVAIASAGSEFFFPGAVHTYRDYNAGVWRVGAGIVEREQDDPDLAAALNALAFGDINRWPRDVEGGSAQPLRTWMVDAPEANIVVNYMGRAVGFLSGIPEYPAAFQGLGGVDNPAQKSFVTNPPSAGTVPYVNPANHDNPSVIHALNFLLDDADYKL